MFQFYRTKRQEKYTKLEYTVEQEIFASTIFAF